MPNFTGVVGKAYGILRNGNNEEPVSGTYTGFETISSPARGTYAVHIFSTPSNTYSPTTRIPDYMARSMFTITPLETSENKNKATSENKTATGTAGGRRRRRSTRRRRRTTRRHR